MWGEERHLHEECGVFGVCSPKEQDVARTYQDEALSPEGEGRSGCCRLHLHVSD